MNNTTQLPADLTDVTSLPDLYVYARAREEGNRCDSSHPSDRPVNLTVLALDLGTTTGWALRVRDGIVTSGSQSFRPQRSGSRFEGGGMRFLRFKRWLAELQASASVIHAVFFEEVRRHAGVDAAHAYGGFLAHLTAWCEHHNIPYQGVPVGTIKKHATGKGNASKDEMIAAVRARRYETTDDNEADALALLFWVIETQEDLTMRVPTPRYHCPLGRLLPNTTDPEEVKRDGWQAQQILVVSIEDRRLDWTERELIRRIGQRLYGRTGDGKA